MTRYEAHWSPKGTTIVKIKDDGISPYEYFTGYDFMGRDTWCIDGCDALRMELEEAEAIVDDLEAAEAVQHFSFRELCDSCGLKYDVMMEYKGGPVPQEAYLDNHDTMKKG